MFLGLLSNGVCTTLANSSYTTHELAHQIRDSAAQLIFVHPMLFSVMISTLKSLDISEEEMRKRVVIMSYADADLREERAQRIDTSWTRLNELLQEGRIDVPVRLSGNETDATILLCYSSGVSCDTGSLPMLFDFIILTILIGTTGLSKGVEVSGLTMLLNTMTWFLCCQTTHRNIVTVLQIYHPVSFPVNRGEEKEICILPLYHIL